MHVIVNTRESAHIALAPSTTSLHHQLRGDVYEIVIGGWGNTRSVIRKGQQGGCSSLGGKSLTQSAPDDYIVSQYPCLKGTVKVKIKCVKCMFLIYIIDSICFIWWKI